MLKFFKRITYFTPEITLRPLFCLKVQKTSLLIFNFETKEVIFFNFFGNRNCNILTDSRKRPKVLADKCKGHQPIKTLLILPVTKTNVNNPLVLKRHDAFLLKPFS